MLKVLAAAEKVARYRHAQLSAVRLSGDLNAKVDNATIEELLATIREEYRKLGPLIDLEVLREPQASRTERRLAVGSRAIEHGRRPGRWRGFRGAGYRPSVLAHGRLAPACWQVPDADLNG
jgi:hypothetical protein